jgi:hypothetical protein
LLGFPLNGIFTDVADERYTILYLIHCTKVCTGWFDDTYREERGNSRQLSGNCWCRTSRETLEPGMLMMNEKFWLKNESSLRATIFLVLGTWYLVLGTWYLVRCRRGLLMAA